MTSNLNENSRYLILNEFESGRTGSTDENLDVYDVSSIEDSSATAQKKNASIEHDFMIRFFHRPILCFHCRDYIWGSGYVGYGCKSCARCVHFKCLIFVKNLKCSNNCSDKPLESITESTVYPIENWSTDTVKEWLAVVNLHRYAELFAKYNITGSKLISLNSDQLYEYRIRDSFHHKAIIECCQELISRSKRYSTITLMFQEMSEFKKNLCLTPYKASRHHFLVHTLSTQAKCESCHHPFLGIIHQALMCQQCGLLVHRQCSSTGLIDCNKNIRHVQSKHYLFGVSLFDLCSNSDSCNQDSSLQYVPFLLIKAFKCIEERAAVTGEDLYDAYRLSADTTKIEPIKQQLNENGIELTRFERYDLNTIAAIVKAFLRDLQDSVIPEEIYEKLINCIQDISTRNLRELIKTALHPQHYDCLSYIMAHLIRVWHHQYRTRGCHYLPDKMFHIFRSILMRPPWEKIVQIVKNIDKQTLVIQRLMLECDWGVELPEYRVKSDRTCSEPLNNPNHSIISSVNSLAALSNFLLPGGNQTRVIASIDEQEWYWGNIANRDNTALILKNCLDGSFIVRNSTDKNPSAPYTLCVMKGTFVKSIKIFNSDLLYDIEKPCRFESVQALIEYYSRVSLKEYNHNLDLKLTYGISKYKFGRTSEWTTDKLYESFKDAIEKYDSLTKSFASIEADISMIREDLTSKRLACEAFDKIIEIYEQQTLKATETLTNLQLKKSNAISATTLLATQFMPSAHKSSETHQSERIERVMLENKLRLESKTRELRGKKEQIESEMEYLKINLSELQEKLDSLRPELIELRKKRENYHMWLLQRGENEDKIQTIIDPSQTHLNHSTSNENFVDNYNPLGKKMLEINTNNIYSKVKTSASMSDLKSLKDESKSTSTMISSIESGTTRSPSQLIDLMDSVNWYRADFTREKTAEVLKDKPNGTFLVRAAQFPSSKYVLSVVADNQPIHIMINEYQNKYFLKLNNSSERRIKYTNSQTSISSNTSNSSTRSRSPSSSDRSVKSPSNSLNLASDDQNRDNKFDTLTDLITYFSKNELRAANQVWDTVLAYPAFYES